VITNPLKIAKMSRDKCLGKNVIQNTFQIAVKFLKANVVPSLAALATTIWLHMVTSKDVKPWSEKFVSQSRDELHMKSFEHNARHY
jgi:hypothetical protein